MKKILYIFVVFAVLASCKKNSSAVYSYSTLIDSLGLQFGTQYTYRHYTSDSFYELGYLTFNADTSFVEIMNTDTFYYHANIIYAYNPNGSSTLFTPGTGTITGESGGLKYIYYPKGQASTSLFPGKAYLAWCCYTNDTIRGNPNDYAPFEYYLEKFAPVFLGTYNDSVVIMPPAITDSSGAIHFSDDKIVILK